jgi:DNA-binding protein H-NS
MKAKRAKKAPARKTAKRSPTKARKSGLDAMTLTQLIALQKRVDTAIETRHEDERSAVRQKVEALAERAGFSVSELFSGSPAGKSNRGKSRVAVKFRHPKNPALTWTGRGRKPRWLVQAGGNIERFRVA